MTREDFIVATALILFASFVLGWFSCWLVGRLTRPGRAEFARHNQLTADLHAAENARDQAITEGKEREAALHERLAFATSELTQSRAALAEASVEIEELRDYIDRNLGKPV
ncbi:hypothetical protein [Paracoccus albus]|uniref:hypothetical protein n=1 Tax=Paracoccus albus TaxID=3017784 RepID=UPI0022F0C825|nr:hypothetical protein [Paracoccus albus]WBU58890.1 hypothetical protein PAF20_08645 [Paracoccus albus]